MKQIRGGHSAFSKQGENHSCDANGCYRIILLRSMGYKPKTDNIQRQRMTFALGHANEEVVAGLLEDAGYTVEREREIHRTLSPEVEFTGHIDVTASKSGEVALYELKSVSSVNSYIKYIKKGNYKLNNLAQLVAYMLTDEKRLGYLVYSNFIYSPAACEVSDKKKTLTKWDKIEPCIRKYKVEIDYKSIIVDGVAHEEYTTDNIVEHMLRSAQVVVDEEVSRIKPGYEGCFFCELKQTCERFDSGDIDGEQWKRLVVLDCVKDS